MTTYTILRFFQEHRTQTIKEGLSLEEAQEHCQNEETSSSTCSGAEGVARTEYYGAWFDGYESE